MSKCAKLGSLLSGLENMEDVQRRKSGFWVGCEHIYLYSKRGCFLGGSRKGGGVALFLIYTKCITQPEPEKEPSKTHKPPYAIKAGKPATPPPTLQSVKRFASYCLSRCFGGWRLQRVMTENLKHRRTLS